MRGEVAALFCDAEDGECGNWTTDAYEGLVSDVNGVRVTETERWPGWCSTDDQDFCPEHAAVARVSEQERGEG